LVRIVWRGGVVTVIARAIGRTFASVVVGGAVAEGWGRARMIGYGMWDMGQVEVLRYCCCMGKRDRAEEG